MARRQSRRTPIEDGSTPDDPSYKHPVEEDEWAESERERKDRIAERARLHSSVGHKLDARLRARGVKPPSRPY